MAEKALHKLDDDRRPGKLGDFNQIHLLVLESRSLLLSFLYHAVSTVSLWLGVDSRSIKVPKRSGAIEE